MQCPNCSHKVKSNFCGYCGQKSIRHVEVSLHDLLHESFHEVVHLDGKIFQTMKMLLTKPGALTAEFLLGRRVRYITPIRLYLTLSVLYFLLSSLIFSAGDVGININIDSKANISEKLKTKADQLEEATRDTPATFEINVSDDDQESLKHPIGRFFKSGSKIIKQNPEAFIEKVRHSFPKILFLLVPIFAVLVWLTHFRSQYSWLSAVYFSLHHHSAAFAGLIAILPLRMYMGPDAMLPQTLWMTWIFLYLTFAFKRVWKDSTAMALVRSATVLSIYTLFFAIGILGLVSLQFYLIGARA